MSENDAWFNDKGISGIDNEVKNIIENYKNLVTSVKNLCTIMNSYINVSGMWNDDNSIEVAKWWNKGNSEIGELKYDEGEGLRINPSNKGPNPLCGFDRMQSILNKAAYMFWALICFPLYHSVLNQFDNTFANSATRYLQTCYDFGKSDKSMLDITEVGDDFRALFGCTESFNSVEPNNVSGSSDIKKIFEFKDKINDFFENEFKHNCANYIKSFNNICNDNYEMQQYFGLNNNTHAVGLQFDFNTSIDTNTYYIKNDITTAVDSYVTMISGQFDAYLNLNFK